MNRQSTQFIQTTHENKAQPDPISSLLTKLLAGEKIAMIIDCIKSRMFKSIGD